MMGIAAVIKVGGSLSRGPGLPSLCREIGTLGKQHPVIVVPGGGDFAEQVRHAYRRYELDESTAHWMALLAMDQYGYMLHRLIPGSFLTPDLRLASAAAEKGSPAVLLPYTVVNYLDPLPHSWHVTSDTIAAWIARQTACPLLILLKDVDGLIVCKEQEMEVIHEVTPEGLSRHRGCGIDGYLAEFLASVSLTAWIVNGLYPERLRELFAVGLTIGTRIAPAIDTQESVRFRTSAESSGPLRR